MKTACLAFVLGAATASAGRIELAERLYSSARAWQVGDLLTVLVNEKTSSSKAEALSTSKSGEGSSDPTVLGDISATEGYKWLSRKLGRVDVPVYKLKASSSFSGSGSSSSSENLSASFTVRVTDVLENGVLVIHGERQVAMRKETMEMILTGLVRRRDVGANNTVDSSKIADAHIYYETGGAVSRGTNPGFFWRIFQVLNPF